MSMPSNVKYPRCEIDLNFEAKQFARHRAENHHTRALEVCRNFFDGAKPDDHVALADQALLRAIAQMENAVGYMPHDLAMVRCEIKHRISVRAMKAGYSHDVLRQFGF